MKIYLLFGIKPTRPSNEYGYLKTKSINRLNKVTKFIEKPTEQKAKKIIKSGGYWNSGMFYLKKSSIINNFKKYQTSIYKSCLKSLEKSKVRNNTYFLNKKFFDKCKEISFDYAILEKSKEYKCDKA